MNDLYVRFFRMAERRIAEKTGRGVVCFISNYSWLDGLSFTGMRERYLEAFDAIRIDNLNGDSRKTGKTTPDGDPDPSIFSTPEDPVGIQVGTAITTLVRKREHAPAAMVGFRQLWGQAKREELTETAEVAPDALYDDLSPMLPLGLPFAPVVVSDDWATWPALPDLFPASFPGVQSKRDSFLIDIDLDRLKARMGDYFDPALAQEEIARRYPAAMKSSSGFVVSDAGLVRATLLARGGPDETGFIRHAYRPFDNRWLYWEAGHGLLGRPVPAYKPHVFKGNLCLVSQHKPRREWSPPQVVSDIGCLDLIDRGATCFPVWLRGDDVALDTPDGRRPNLSPTAARYLDALGLGVEDLFHHVLAVLHDPDYRVANAGALRMEWPRIPLPAWPDGDGAAEELAASRRPRPRTCPTPRPRHRRPRRHRSPPAPRSRRHRRPRHRRRRQHDRRRLCPHRRLGHLGAGDAVMPGQGRLAERPAAAGADPALGLTSFDVYLNDRAYWRNVPAAVWHYKLGGYQVLKKWLSYRDRDILGRPLSVEEVQHFTDTARRIAAILGLVAQG